MLVHFVRLTRSDSALQHPITAQQMGDNQMSESFSAGHRKRSSWPISGFFCCRSGAAMFNSWSLPPAWRFLRQIPWKMSEKCVWLHSGCQVVSCHATSSITATSRTLLLLIINDVFLSCITFGAGLTPGRSQRHVYGTEVYVGCFGLKQKNMFDVILGNTLRSKHV